MSNLKLKAMVLTVALFAGGALADGDTMPTVDQTTERSCADAQRDALLLREMARSDGDTNPQYPEIPVCNEDSAGK